MFTTELSFIFATLSLLSLSGISALPDPPDVNWTYAGEDTWYKDYPECGGKKQSPVDINTGDVVQAENVENLELFHLNSTPLNMTLHNNGLELQFLADYPEDETPFIRGGFFDGDYVLNLIHFQSGFSDTNGSAHTVNGHGFPLELHIVYYKREYGNASASFAHADGFVTIVHFFRIDEAGNPPLRNLEGDFNDVVEPRTTVIIEPFPLSDFGVTPNFNYVFYHGSLTGPPCSEIQAFIISDRALKVSEEQVQKIRKVKYTSGGTSNNRGTQPLDGRKLSYVQQNNGE